jgi:hypothetical protein
MSNLFNNCDCRSISSGSGSSAHSVDVGRHEFGEVVRDDVIDGPENFCF